MLHHPCNTSNYYLSLSICGLLQELLLHLGRADNVQPLPASSKTVIAERVAKEEKQRAELELQLENLKVQAKYWEIETAGVEKGLVTIKGRSAADPTNHELP